MFSESRQAERGVNTSMDTYSLSVGDSAISQSRIGTNSGTIGVSRKSGESTCTKVFLTSTRHRDFASTFSFHFLRTTDNWLACCQPHSACRIKRARRLSSSTVRRMAAMWTSSFQIRREMHTSRSSSLRLDLVGHPKTRNTSGSLIAYMLDADCDLCRPFVSESYF